MSNQKKRIRLLQAFWPHMEGSIIDADEVASSGNFLGAPLQYRIGDQWIQERYVEVVEGQ